MTNSTAIAPDQRVGKTHTSVTAMQSIPATIAGLLGNMRVWVTAVAVLFALQLALIFSHDPWLDEWQAVQIAIQSPTFHDLLINLRYEGHPPLWYLILRLTVWLGVAPFAALSAVAASLAILSQSAILFLSPFRRAERLAIASSQFVLFEFLTISRSLTLGVTCAVLAVALWRRGHWSWLFIALLPMCDFLFGVISLGLAFLRYREGRAPLLFMGLWIGMALLAAWTIRPMPDILPALQRQGLVRGTGVWIGTLGTVGLPLQWGHGILPQWNMPAPRGLGALGLALFVAVCRIEMRARRSDAVMLGGFVALTYLFSLSVYPLAIRHMMLIALVLILLVWRRLDAGGEQPSRWFRRWLALAAVCGLLNATYAFIRPFDAAPQAAARIRALGLLHKDWMAFPQPVGQGVAAINGMVFERTSDRCIQDFVRWNHHSWVKAGTPSLFYGEIGRKVREDGRFYVISDRTIADRPPLLRRIASIPAGYDGQPFYLYVAGEDRPDSKAHHPRCNGSAIPFPLRNS